MGLGLGGKRPVKPVLNQQRLWWHTLSKQSYAAKRGALLYLTNWKRALISTRAPLGLAITHPCAHLHPKSKLIHFAKSSAATHLACWWAAVGSFSLQSSLCRLKERKGEKQNKTDDTERERWRFWLGFLYQHADTLLAENAFCGTDIFHHLCAARQDHKVVATDIQMGSFCASK